jgi:hypothetical protein
MDSILIQDLDDRVTEIEDGGAFPESVTKGTVTMQFKENNFRVGLTRHPAIAGVAVTENGDMSVTLPAYFWSDVVFWRQVRVGDSQPDHKRLALTVKDDTGTLDLQGMVFNVLKSEGIDFNGGLKSHGQEVLTVWDCQSIFQSFVDANKTAYPNLKNPFHNQVDE